MLSATMAVLWVSAFLLFLVCMSQYKQNDKQQRSIHELEVRLDTYRNLCKSYESRNKMLRKRVETISMDAKQMEFLEAENDRLSRRNTELETQMRRMVAKQAEDFCSGCDWRDQD